MKPLLLVALGGAGGSVLRYLAGLAAVSAFGPGFPFGTLFVNVTGSFLIGVLSHLLSRGEPPAGDLRPLLITGVLGGYTTFSAFSLDVAVLVERGDLLAASLYLAASLALSLAAVFAGLALMRAIV